MADANAQRLVIKIVGDTSELESSLSKLKSTASTIVSGAAGGAPLSGARPGQISADVQGQVKAVSARLADLRRESKSVGMEIYRNIGNPFLVVSSLSQRITGIYQLQRDAEAAGQRIELLNNRLRRAAAQGRAVAVDNLLKQLDAAIAKQRALNAEMGSGRMLMRGVADFFVNQFMTAGLFMWFQLMSMVVQGLVSIGTEIVANVLAPVDRAKERAQEFLDLVDKMGGPKQIAIALQMNEEDRAIMMSLVSGQALQSQAEALLKFEKTKTDMGSMADEMTGLTREVADKILGERQMQAENTNPNFLTPVVQWLDRLVGRTATSQETAALNRELRGGLAASGVDAARQMKDLTEAQRKAIEEIGTLEQKRVLKLYDSIQLEKSRTTELTRQRDELERARFLLTGNTAGLGEGAGAELDALTMKIKSSQDRAAKYQRQLDALNAAEQRRQANRTVAEARSEVIRAGIVRPGMSGFEVAANIMEARQRLIEVQQQAAIERRQAALMEKIARETAKQNDYNKQVDIIRNGMELALANQELDLTMSASAVDQMVAVFRPRIDRMNRFNIPS